MGRMYQDDMMDEGGGNGGCSVGEGRQVEEETIGMGTSTIPNDPCNRGPYHNHVALSSDPNLNRQSHEYPSAPSPPAAAASAYPYNSNQQQQHRGCSPSQPDAQCASNGFSTSPRNSSGRPSGANNDGANNEVNNGQYFMMPDSETQSESPPAKSTNGKSSAVDEANDRYEAQVALGIQLVLVFFCLLILVAVAMAIFSHRGYWVIIAVCLSIIISLLVGLCCFLYRVVHEDDAPRINQKHMPKWYKTITKIIKDEYQHFREDWQDMCNNIYLLEHGDATVAAEASTGISAIGNPSFGGANHGGAAVDANGITVPPGHQHKPKKRKGKSALFKLVAKPAAVLASFGRKRKGKKKQKKSEQPLMP